MLFGNEILTTAQMRAIEFAAIEGGKVTGAELMERAGKGAARIIADKWPQPGLAIVLCGPGNNGGDGFVVARHLRQRGWRIRLGLHGDAARLSPDARRMHDEWAALGDAEPLTVDLLSHRTPRPDIIVDALLGTGLSRAPSGELAGVLSRLGSLPGIWGHHLPAIISLDAPSGLNMDSGKCFGGSCPEPCASDLPLADLTIAFHSLKPGHLLDNGPHYCGEVHVVDIGLPGWAAPGPSLREIGGPDASTLRKHRGHKYRYGHALILSGPDDRAGAARLAARAALRVGAGLVTLCPPSTGQAAATGPDALMRCGIDSDIDLKDLLADERIRAVCLGPGLGQERAVALTPEALQSGRGCVLDADALTAFAVDPAALFELTHSHCVMTPHTGEFARLFPDLSRRLADDVGFSKLAAVQAAAARTGCVVLLKGEDTVIAAPNGDAGIHRADDIPWLATAGAGDVLAGIIAGLLTRGKAPLTAAGAGAALHAAAARRFGPGLIADDLPDEIPGVFRDMNL